MRFELSRQRKQNFRIFQSPKVTLQNNLKDEKLRIARGVFVRNFLFLTCNSLT